MNSSQLINQDSGNVEYYTPEYIVDAARATMSGIDLDPASSPAANERIRAGRIYTREDDGLRQPWFGKVWMNHPFGRGVNHLWINKLVEDYHRSHIEQACCITFASTSEKWFQPLMKFPQCFLATRTHFITPDGSVKRGATKGCVVTYLGPWIAVFAHQFGPLGIIKVPYQYRQAA